MQREEWIKVVSYMSVSQDGYNAGPGDQDIDQPHAWYFGGGEPFEHSAFKPAPGADRDDVAAMFADTGAFLFGRRTHDTTNGWGGEHPVNARPIFILTHQVAGEPVTGPSGIHYVTGRSRELFKRHGTRRAADR